MKKNRIWIAIAIALIISSCSTLEIVHEPLKCKGQPESNLNLTREEEKSIPNSAWYKIAHRFIEYQERINEICKDIGKHNELHN